MDWQQTIESLQQLKGLEKLEQIMVMLRDPKHGCPWDIKQTFATIVPYTIEEAYEVADAIEREDFEDLKKELGDLLFQVVFYGQMAKEQDRFDLESIAEAMCDKLISRHPHVFSDAEFDSEEKINANWEQTKANERQANDPRQTSVLDDIPLAMPALSRAYKMQKRAASVGFDWPDVTGAFDKIEEEVDEVKAEIAAGDKQKLAEELGDLYFALTNVTRHLGIKPEDALRAANNKFERRFRQVEAKAHEKQTQLQQMSLQQMDELWDQVKRSETNLSQKS